MLEVSNSHLPTGKAFQAPQRKLVMHSNDLTS